MSQNERAAHEYADHGWPVFPLAEGSKIPAIASAHDRGTPCAGECTNDGHGFRDASTEHARISAWWRGHPDRNIGVATGERYFDVLDIDQGKAGKPSGFKALNELKRAGLIPGIPQRHPDTWRRTAPGLQGLRSALVTAA